MTEPKMKNYMEDCVQYLMPEVLAHFDICQCERCQLDIMAYVLNQLPPKYIVTSKGNLYTKLSTIQAQFDVDIVAAITKAVKIISANPRHDE